MGYTASAKVEELKETWYCVDASGKVLGKLASDIATVLRGKHMPNFTPHCNMKTHVVVLNVEKVHLSGNKLVDKKYYTHSQWRGGLREASAGKLLDEKPEELVRRAVWGMLPKGSLGKATMTRLRIYSGSDHPHAAQKPGPLPSYVSKSPKKSAQKTEGKK